MRKFEITLFAADPYSRIPLCREVLTYVEDFVTEKILEPNSVIIDSKWKTVVCLLIEEDSSFGSSLHVGSPFIYAEGVILFPGRTFSREKIKAYAVQLQASYLKRVGRHPVENFVLLLTEVFVLFFTTNFKKTKQEQLRSILQTLDMSYLLSLPYPAPFEKQQFAGDSPEKEQYYQAKYFEVKQ